MKFAIVVLFAVFAVAFADVSELGPSQEYLPPGQDIGFAGAGAGAIDVGIGGGVGGGVQEGAPGHVLADDGYRYKTVRRLRFRRRRY